MEQSTVVCVCVTSVALSISECHFSTLQTVSPNSLPHRERYYDELSSLCYLLKFLGLGLGTHTYSTLQLTHNTHITLEAL